MTPNKILPLSCIALALSLFACGADTAEEHPGDHSEHHSMEPEAPAIPRHPLADQVEGTYILRTVSTSEGTFPIVGKTKSTMSGFSLATIKQEGEGFIITEQSCHFEMGGSEAMKPIVSDIVPQSMPPLSATITFEGEGDTLTYRRSETTQLIGVNLDDPANDPLPTEVDDPRIFDQEGDGKPGATASIAGGIDGGQLLSGEAYFIQRQRFSYSGTRTRDGKMEGMLIDDSNQKVLDATNDFLKLEVTDSTTLLEECTASLIPVDSTYDCARVSNEALTLFPPLPSDEE